VGVRFFLLILLAVVIVVNCGLVAQTETATLSGYVTDPDGKVMAHADVQVVNTDTNIAQTTQTNEVGLYLFPSLHPGRYRITVKSPGFKEFVEQDLVLHVQDTVSQNFKMQVGSISESITVMANATPINTTDATVSTVIDRNFAENLPMNGRSFQTLINLAPGVVVVPSNIDDGGQFTVNGQRASSNYWMVDGVSANVGISAGSALGGTPGNGFAGALGSFSAMGGTNSLVSVDALQEFRIQTSTYAPEFGRTPGGQISIVTRSGTGQFHGTLFDYFRNDILDANNWFNNAVPPPAGPLPKAKERQNDFGGTFSGPILEDRTFFFFSYEGLRLRLPQTALSLVPDLNARQNAVPAMQPYLNAYPVPNGPDSAATSTAQFNASFSNPSTLDAYSIRVDHRLSNSVSVFGRYNYSPSGIVQRGEGNGYSLSTVYRTNITTQTATLGSTWTFSPAIANDFRLNYSRTNADSYSYLDSFGGAVPFPSTSQLFPSPFTSKTGLFEFLILPLYSYGGNLNVGELGRNLQRQVNIVDSISIQKDTHILKLGIDFRRLSPQFEPFQYQQYALFTDVPSAASGNLLDDDVASNLAPTFVLRNLGMYAQDTWRTTPRLTLTYGLRWDVDFVPSSKPSFPAVVGFNLNDLSGLALAPAGVPPYATTYGNVAPRLGVAYQLSQHQDWQTVLRGGIGLFYDLATSEMGNQMSGDFYPFGNYTAIYGGTFPLSPAQLSPPQIAPPTATSGLLFAVDPHLRLPHTLEWNIALEQAIGKQQTISVSYIGAAGRRLVQQANVVAPNQNLLQAVLLANATTSDYDALQAQFQRRLARGLQSLVSYTWSHSIDTASAGSSFVSSNAFVPSSVSHNRGPSDFDIRHALSASVTYDVPVLKVNPFITAFLRGWSLDNIVQARSAPPVDVSDANFYELANGFYGDVRPDLVPAQPVYVRGSACNSVFGLGGCPGGKGLNPSAFTNPPTDPQTGLPLRQGDVPRNFLRGFGAFQWDFSVHRDFPIHESLKLQFRAEMFNVLNHPNFGPPSGAFGTLGFGIPTQMLAQSLSGGNLGGGGFSALYQFGGPRSIQLALKLTF